MTELRRLTPHGETKFKEYLTKLRNGEAIPPPFHLLSDSISSAPIDISIQLEESAFKTRYDFGQGLLTTLSPLDTTSLSRDHGIWSWIGLHFFDQTCPSKSDGTRNPGEDARHILPAVYNYRKFYRHLAREAWLAVRLNGAIVKPLLAGGLDRRGDLLEQLSSRIELFGNTSVMAAAVELYINSDGKQSKLASAKDGGSPRRLATLVRQLKLTYDLRSSSAAQLVGLLPPEEFCPT